MRFSLVSTLGWVVLHLSLTSLSAQTIWVPGGTVGNSNNAYIGMGESNPNTFLDIKNALGHAIVSIENTGDGNISGIDFVRERASGPGVPGGAIFMKSDVSGNHALLYLQAQSASAGAGITGALTPNNGVRLVLRGGDGVASFEYGSVGIGKTSAGYKLDVENTGGQVARFKSTLTNSSADVLIIDRDASHTRAALQIQGEGGAREVLFAASAGFVGIGTTTPSHELTVNGTIRAKEVIVDTGWADYVFSEDYQLAPLSEVEAHIEEKGHLPDIPSVEEVAEIGISVGEIQSLLLAKIEELTLHTIRQEKRLEAQELRLNAQESELRILQRQNALLRNQTYR